MKMSPRSQKLSGIIIEKISPIIHQFLTPEEVGFLTVTAVEVSGDLEWIDIFVDSIGPRSGWLDRLNRFAPKIAHELLKVCPQRRAFKIRFKMDKGNENAEKLGF